MRSCTYAIALAAAANMVACVYAMRCLPLPLCVRWHRTAFEIRDGCTFVHVQICRFGKASMMHQTAASIWQHQQGQSGWLEACPATAYVAWVPDPGQVSGSLRKSVLEAMLLSTLRARGCTRRERAQIANCCPPSSWSKQCMLRMHLPAFGNHLAVFLCLRLHRAEAHAHVCKQSMLHEWLCGA